MLVPRRADHGRRDGLWMFCKEWWERSLDIPIVEGCHNDGPFNRSAAINSAAKLAGDWRVAIIADADTIMHPLRLAMAAQASMDRDMAILPFTDRIEMDYRQTELLIMSGRISRFVSPIKNTISGIIIVPRMAWDATGGFDEDYVGWGPEDLDFFERLEKASGKVKRWPGTIWHLWHEQNRPQDLFTENVRKFMHKREARILVDR